SLMQPGPELCLGEPPAPKPHGQQSGREFLKPTIWVSPSRVVALGGNITIRCEGWYRSTEFFLHKAGHPNLQSQTVPDGTVAEFPIASVGQEDGGSYACEYRAITQQDRWSYPSDPVEIIVAGEGYPKPSISLSPSGGVFLGGAVTIQCRGQRRGVRFVLNKERRHFPPVDSDDIEAVFSSSNMRREDGGSYSCSYHSRSEPFAVSYPSDPVELPSVSPWGFRRSLDHKPVHFPATPRTAPLYKLLRSTPLRSPTCEPFQPSPQTAPLAVPWATPSDPSLPRPSISLSPTGVIAPGENVTIWCQGRRWNVRFFLHKAGDLNPQQHMDPAGDGAEFRIPTVGRQHGGNYSCSYRPRSEPFVSSQPSDPVQLVVAGEGLGSVSQLPAPPSEGRHLTGCSEPGSAQNPRTGLDRGGDSVTGGFPRWGEGDPCPQGELSSRSWATAEILVLRLPLPCPQETLVLFPQGELT
uniref:Immunoglobulin domain-containing protein n=1 Tax=Terrapene triunguis TaxID=2587831 RepID=A0A674JKM8_9SAUR